MHHWEWCGKPPPYRVHGPSCALVAEQCALPDSTELINSVYKGCVSISINALSTCVLGKLLMLTVRKIVYGWVVRTSLKDEKV
jgi:hypothetical protein